MNPEKCIRVAAQQHHDWIDAELDVLCRARQLNHAVHDMWPVPPGASACDVTLPMLSRRNGHSTAAVYSHEDAGLSRVVVEGGQASVGAFGTTPNAAQAIMAELREQLPAGDNPDLDVVPITFWTYSPHGPRSTRRDLDASTWEGIAANYPGCTAPALDVLMDSDFRPGTGGQLILWHGDPGTGKTTALRALARQWRQWCDVHYVVDPDRFFGDHADYMMDVLMGHGDDLAPVGEAPPEPKWRLLILEDCGEMLQPDARREVGQALSRFLNACDGLIGRGLRVLVLVTTNEPVTKLHEAVARPGRCSAQVEFERFSLATASEWLADWDVPVPDGSPTLADLFDAISGARIEARTHRTIGFAA